MQSLDQTALWICKSMVGIEEHLELYHQIDSAEYYRHIV